MKAYLKKHSHSILKLAGLLILLIIGILIDSYWSEPDNPFTFPLIIFVINGLLYTLIPEFYKSHKTPILLIYGFIVSFYLLSKLMAKSYVVDDDVFVFLVMFSFPILLMLWIFDQWKSFKRLKDKQINAELQMLKAQMNPHFFFNTLNNLYGLTIEKSDEAPKVILKLAEMMRFTIYKASKDVVSIQDEVNYLKKYIELHTLRYKERISIQFKENIDSDYKIAPLLFIVLLENAFKHGAESLTKNAYINITLEAINSQIRFKIENNFRPLKTKKEIGIGISNLKQRLSLIYPKRYEFMIDSKEEVYVANLKINLNG